MAGELPDRDQGFLVLRPLLWQQSGFWEQLSLSKFPAFGFGRRECVREPERAMGGECLARPKVQYRDDASGQRSMSD